MYVEAAGQPEQEVTQRQKAALPLGEAPGGFWGGFCGSRRRYCWRSCRSLFAGYRMRGGESDDSDSVSQQWANPQLYANDPMVAGTLKDYPSFFFRALAVLTRVADVPLLYFILHVATSFAVLMGTYWLGRTIFKDRLAGMIAALLLFAGHQRALAGDEMYSMGFTHTWAVFPLAIIAMVFIYRVSGTSQRLCWRGDFQSARADGAYLAAMFGIVGDRGGGHWGGRRWGCFWGCLSSFRCRRW
jgi:hypothetical protein